jgi:hypothetical protein
VGLFVDGRGYVEIVGNPNSLEIIWWEKVEEAEIAVDDCVVVWGRERGRRRCGRGSQPGRRGGADGDDDYQRGEGHRPGLGKGLGEDSKLFEEIDQSPWQERPAVDEGLEAEPVVEGLDELFLLLVIKLKL